MRYDENADTAADLTAEQSYKRELRHGIDVLRSGVDSRFKNIGYKVFSALERLVTSAAAGKSIADSENFKFIVKFYGDDLDELALRADLENLSLLGVQMQSLADFISWIKAGKNGTKYPQLATLAQLALVLPASNAVSERSFSALRRVKAYTRASTGQNRLNSLMRLHVHRNHCDNIDRQRIIRDFVACHPYRSTRIAIK